MSASSTARLFDVFTEEDRKNLIAAGAVGDLLFNFFDKDGKLVDHAINERVMSVPVGQLQNVPLRILTSGGLDKSSALIGGLRLLKPHIFITDEASAQKILDET